MALEQVSRKWENRKKSPEMLSVKCIADEMAPGGGVGTANHWLQRQGHSHQPFF